MARCEIAKALRAREAWALDGLRDALILCDGALPEVASVLGFAGPSSLWRVAYDVPEVRALLAEYGRRRGKKTNAT